MNLSPPIQLAARRASWLSAALGVLLLAGAGSAHSRRPPQLPLPEPPQQAQAQGAVWLAASERTLDAMRGGFDLGTGLVVSFGISRAVYINGQLITSTSFQIGDLTKLTAPQAAALGQQIATQMQVVQNGPGNTLESGAAGTGSARTVGTVGTVGSVGTAGIAGIAGTVGSAATTVQAVPLATLIQNTLNNQTIRNQTVIDVSSNGLSMLKNMNLQATISQAVANAVGNR